MPLMTPGGFTGVTVEIQGKIDDIMAKADVLDKKLDQFSARRKAADAAAVQSAKKVSMSWTDFRSMYSTVLDVVRVGQQVWAATGQEFVNYAEQVKNLSRNIGVTAEDASKLIQVADDVRISYASLSTALKVAQKQGIDVSSDGLAKLADQYKKLAPGVERTQFLLKTFGKNGLEMGKELERGADGLNKMSDAVEKNLILTKESIRISDDYQAAVDNLGDSWTAFIMGPSQDVTKFLTDSYEGWSMLLELTTRVKSEGINPWDGDAVNALGAQIYQEHQAEKALRATSDAMGENSNANGENEDAVNAQKRAVDEATRALDDYKKMLDDVSQANQDAEKFIQSYADTQKSYLKDLQKLNDEKASLMEEYAQAVKEHGRRSREALDTSAELQKTQEGILELQGTWHENYNKMIYDATLAKVAVDGLTDAEFKATQDLAVKIGIRTQAEADQAKAAMDTASAYAAGIEAQEDVMRENNKNKSELERLEDAKQAAIDKTTDATVDGSNTAQQAISAVTEKTRAEILEQYNLQRAVLATADAYRAMGGYGPFMPTVNPSNHNPSKVGERDSGGPGIAGTPYLIGAGAQPEMFIPSTNGTFVPNADKKGLMGGTTYNIVVNNPKRETTEATVRRTLKSLSYTGAAA